MSNFLVFVSNSLELLSRYFQVPWENPENKIQSICILLHQKKHKLATPKLFFILPTVGNRNIRKFRPRFAFLLLSLWWHRRCSVWYGVFWPKTKQKGTFAINVIERYLGYFGFFSVGIWLHKMKSILDVPCMIMPFFNHNDLRSNEKIHTHKMGPLWKRVLHSVSKWV